MDDGRVLPRAAAIVGGLGLLAEFPIYLSSGLVAPLWAIGLLLAFWACLAWLAVRWWRTRPAWILLLPIAGAVVWVGVLTFGESVLGWQA